MRRRGVHCPLSSYLQARPPNPPSLHNGARTLWAIEKTTLYGPNALIVARREGSRGPMHAALSRLWTATEITFCIWRPRFLLRGKVCRLHQGNSRTGRMAPFSPHSRATSTRRLKVSLVDRVTLFAASLSVITFSKVGCAAAGSGRVVTAASLCYRPLDWPTREDLLDDGDGWYLPSCPLCADLLHAILGCLFPQSLSMPIHEVSPLPFEHDPSTALESGISEAPVKKIAQLLYRYLQAAQ